MELCEQLTADAQKWADAGNFAHCNERNGAGENIGELWRHQKWVIKSSLAWNCASSAEAAVAQAVQQWYDEEKGKIHFCAPTG